MKKVIVLVLLMVVFLIPSLAWADFFNDEDLFSRIHGWEYFCEDTLNRTSLLDQNDRLEWVTSPGWYDEYNARAEYASIWAFDLAYNFSFDVRMHLNSYGNGGLIYGLFEDSPQDSPFWQGVNWGQMDAVWFCDYNTETDEFRSAVESGLGNFSTLISGLKTDHAMCQLKVFLGGYSYGESFSGSDAYFWDFAVSSGTMTPEPLSFWLMGIGAFFFSARRKI